MQERDDGNYNIGANPSAEEADEDVEANVTTGINIVLSQRLVEVSLKKEDYKADIKVYVKNLIKKVAETNAARAEFLKANLQKVIANWLSDFNNMSVFRGETMGEGGTYVLCKYPEGDCSIGCKIDVFILKDAVEEEKCVSFIINIIAISIVDMCVCDCVIAKLCHALY